MTSLGALDELDAGLRTVAGFLAELTDADGGVVDLYLTGREPADADALAADIEARVADGGLPDTLRRLAVSVAYPGGAMEQFTFRPDGDRLTEERVVRGLHPMIARRLRFWRLSPSTWSACRPRTRTPISSTAPRRGVRRTSGTWRWRRCAT